MHGRFSLLTAQLAGWLITCIVVCLMAAAPPTTQSPTPIPLRTQIFAAFDRADYSAAARLIEKYLRTNTSDFTMIYNAACAYSQLGERNLAAEYLFKSVQAGFNDFNLMKRDPDLKNIRNHETYQAILEALNRVADKTVDNAFDQWKTKYGEKNYRYEIDEKRRIAYATALNETSHQEMRKMLEEEADHLINTLFESPPDYKVLIAIPTPGDANRLLKNPRIGGLYEHHRRRLVARDIGGTLRHEFFHALHYGHMERIGQQHALWIQEGMASLYEDYKIRHDGSVEYLPNDRRNVIKRLQESERLMPWGKLFPLPEKQFMHQAGQLYPQVRSIFQFVADRNVLGLWYRTYVRTFEEDKTGKIAFERTFGKSLEYIERDWRRWLRQQPMVDHDIRLGDAALGILAAEHASNDGIVIDDVIPDSGAQRAKLRPGDVIVEVDGRATRSFAELRRIIGGKEVGDRVRVRIRRDGAYRDLTILLRPRRR